MAYVTSLFIAAPPDEVFDCVVIPQKLVRWMGDRAALRAQAGGPFEVDINGVLIRGEFIEVERPHRLVLSWGQLGNDVLPPGASRVTFEFIAEGDGTLLRLTHDGLPQVEAEKHALGWPHFLARLGVLARGGDPGRDPFADSSPAHSARA